MKLFRFFGIALTVILLCTNLASCSKDGYGTNNNDREKKLVKWTYIGEENGAYYSHSAIYIYDNKGRLSEIRATNDGNFLYIWENDETLKLIYDGEHHCSYTITNGLVRSEYRPEASAQNAYTYYTYNLDGRLIDDGYTEFVWEGEKLVREKADNRIITYSYTGDTCKKGYNPYLLLFTDDFFAANPDLLGFRTNQLPKESTFYYNGSNVVGYTETYDYEFDYEGYLTKVEITDSEGYSWSYTYTWE